LHHARLTVLLPDLDRFSIEEGMARVALRGAREARECRLAADDERLIEVIAGLFEDVRLGPIARTSRVRRDRQHATVFLVRQVTGWPPRVLVEVLGMRPRYLRFALERGCRLVEQAKRDGRIDQALDQLRQAWGE
jgi:hypothetical protein